MARTPLQEKAAKARRVASESSMASRATVNRNAKTAKVSLKPLEELKAASKIYPTVAAERARTARRATFIANREEVKSSQKRISAATGNVARKAAPKKKTK